MAHQACAPVSKAQQPQGGVGETLQVPLTKTIVASLKLHCFPRCRQSSKSPKRYLESTQLKCFLLLHHALVISIPFYCVSFLLDSVLGLEDEGLGGMSGMPGIRLEFYSLSFTNAPLKYPLFLTECF